MTSHRCYFMVLRKGEYIRPSAYYVRTHYESPTARGPRRLYVSSNGDFLNEV